MIKHHYAFQVRTSFWFVAVSSIWSAGPQALGAGVTFAIVFRTQLAWNRPEQPEQPFGTSWSGCSIRAIERHTVERQSWERLMERFHMISDFSWNGTGIGKLWPSSISCISASSFSCDVLNTSVAWRTIQGTANGRTPFASSRRSLKWPGRMCRRRIPWRPTEFAWSSGGWRSTMHCSASWLQNFFPNLERDPSGWLRHGGGW